MKEQYRGWTIFPTALGFQAMDEKGVTLESLPKDTVEDAKRCVDQTILARKCNHVPEGGFLLDRPVRRRTKKSNFLLRLERTARLKPAKEPKTVWFHDPNKVIDISKARKKR